MPSGITPLFDGHRWRLKRGQDNVVRRGQLDPEVIGAATVGSGGKPREEREVYKDAVQACHHMVHWMRTVLITVCTELRKGP